MDSHQFKRKSTQFVIEHVLESPIGTHTQLLGRIAYTYIHMYIYIL